MGHATLFGDDPKTPPKKDSRDLWRGYRWWCALFIHSDLVACLLRGTVEIMIFDAKRGGGYVRNWNLEFCVAENKAYISISTSSVFLGGSDYSRLEVV